MILIKLIFFFFWWIFFILLMCFFVAVFCVSFVLFFFEFWIFTNFRVLATKEKVITLFFNLQLHNLILKYYLSYQILYIVWRFLCSQLKHSEVRKQKSKKRRISNRRMFKYLVSNSDNCRLREMMLNAVRSDIHH